MPWRTIRTPPAPRLVGVVMVGVLAASACASGPVSRPRAESAQVPASPAQTSSNGEVAGEELPDAVVAAIPIDGFPSSVAVVGDRLWVADAESKVLWKVARDSGEVVDTVEYGRKGESRYFGGIEDVRIYPAGDSVFVLEGPRGTEAVRVDARTGEILGRLDVPSPLGAVGTKGAIWISSFDPYEVLKVDLGTNKVTARVPSEGPTGLGQGFGRVWVLNHRGNSVSAIDPRSNELEAEIPVNAPFPQRLGVGEGGVWVSSPASSTVLRIDPRRGKVVASISVSGDPQDFAFGAGAVWVGTQPGVTRIDAETNQVTGTITLGSHAWGVMAFDRDGFLWAATPDTRTLFKIDPTKV